MRIIVPLVLILHIMLAIFLIEWEKQIPNITPKKMISVKTVKLTPKPVVKASNKKEIALAEPALEIKKQISEPVSEIRKQTIGKSAPPTPKPVIKKKPVAKPIPKVEPKKALPVQKIKIEPATKPDIQKKEVNLPAKEVKNMEWIALAKEKIGKISNKSDNISATSNTTLNAISTPTSIKSFESELFFTDSSESLNAKEIAYRDELAHRLKLYFKLPEYGEVKIKLVVERSGKVISVKILSFQSQKNAEYIEKSLHKLVLPGFGDNFFGADNHEFTIVMSNE